MDKHVDLFDCDCGTHHLRVEFDEEYGFWFAMLEGMADRVPFRHRLRLAWKMLFDGSEYHDHIELNKETAKRLSDFIREQSDTIDGEITLETIRDAGQLLLIDIQGELANKSGEDFDMLIAQSNGVKRLLHQFGIE